MGGGHELQVFNAIEHPGHGSRHYAIAAITQVSKAIGIVVSQSEGRISIIRDGKILNMIHPNKE